MKYPRLSVRIGFQIPVREPKYQNETKRGRKKRLSGVRSDSNVGYDDGPDSKNVEPTNLEREAGNHGSAVGRDPVLPWARLRYAWPEITV